ncbi:polysaccharide biosynthesis protein [Oceanobacillus profundus]|uniref:putative polysaccharide biosynthesis protein n=1 Tax=Oceanobacillus TaxID=182709 RepID=UPI000BA68695|nr:polysaccharide biosynthesis protein [Oceanobacillus profundus]MCM3398004.1 polysaccharide biosynthesis protein [Oceanobacillus profundus]MDO6451322.1 polysaccharide biosynthesis protein [Oceanobacillus profundus]PAE27023.1 low temperature requirement protein B [Paenibacillus sp. 7884-2]
MNENETNKLVKGALLLMLAGLISKVLSAGYRVPLQNLTGDIGFYIYQQVYPILGIAMMLALYGFPSAVSKMTVELKAAGKSLSLHSFYIPVFLLLLALNGAIFLFLFWNADSIAGLVGDVQLTYTYRLAAFAFLLVPFSALLRGVYQGTYEMKPSAYSQVIEQLVRVCIIIAAAIYVAFGNHSLYVIGQAAAIASICGSCAAIVILGIYVAKRRPCSRERYEIPWKYYVRTLLILGLVAALNHMVLLVIQFADAFTLIPGLREYGLSKIEAMEAKGIFDRGQPLIQLGTVLGSSFALALLPSISKQKLKGDPSTFYPYIRGAMLFSFYLAIGATIGLIAIFPEANRLLFQDENGTQALQLLVLAIFLCSVAITAASILQGLGHIKRTAGFILVAFFVKWIGNQLLVPLWGIAGSAMATVVSLLIFFTLVMYELRRKLPELRLLKRVRFRALILGSVSMLVFIALMDWLFSAQASASRIALLIYIVFIAVIGGVIFIICLLRFRAFTKEELRMLPKSELFIRFYKGRNYDE